MNPKHTRIGFLIIMVLAFGAGVLSALPQPPAINPNPIENPNPPDISVPPSGLRNVLLIVADDIGIDRSKQYIPVTGNSPVVLDAFDWISAQTSHWFAVVAFNAPHTPLHTPTANCDGVASLVPDLNGMIECVNYHIDWLLSQLESIGALDSTTIILIGDNGTDSASVLEPFLLSSNPSHKMEVYEGGDSSPLYHRRWLLSSARHRSDVVKRSRLR